MSRKYTDTIDSKLKTAWQVISRMYNAEAEKHGATISMAHFLLNIDSHEGSYASDIAPRLGTESTSLSRIITSLEKKELIVRVADNGDKRRVKIMLTKKGKKEKEHAKNIVRGFNRLVENEIGKKRVTAFFNTIDKITKLAEQQNKSLNHE